MQTFLPYPTFIETFRCLDYRRLGKQRVESWQLIKIISNGDFTVPWGRHPAVAMWRPYLKALIHYYNVNLYVWEERGYNNVVLKRIPLNGEIKLPWWLGNELFHASHRSNLLRKVPEHYTKFGWKEPPVFPYIWPTAVEGQWQCGLG